MIHKILDEYNKSLAAPAKASFWFVVCNVLQKSVYFIMIPIYTRILSTEEYGIYSLFTSWVPIMAAFAGLNLAGNSYNVGMIKYEDNQDRYTSCMQGLWWANTTLWFIIILAFHRIWEKYSGLSLCILSAVFADIYAMSCFDLWTARQKFDFRYKSLVILTILVTVITPLVSVLFVCLLPNKAMTAIWCKVGVLAVFSFGIGVINLRKGHAIFDKGYWIEALKFNIPLIAYYLSLTVLNQSDRIMIGSIEGADKAGIYSIAYSLAMILTLVNSAVHSSFAPWEYKKIKEGNADKIKVIANGIMFMAGVLNLALMAAAPDIIRLFTPEPYHESIWVVPPVALSAFFMCLYQFFVNIEFYYKEKTFVMIASIAVALLNIILNYIFINIYGYLAAAYTTLVSYIAFSVAHYLFMMKTCREEMNGYKVYNIQSLMVICLLMLVSTALFIFSYNYDVIRYTMIAGMITLLLYMAKSKKFWKRKYNNGQQFI